MIKVAFGKLFYFSLIFLQANLVSENSFMDNLLFFLDSIHPLSEELRTYLLRTVKSRNLRKKAFLLRPGHVCRCIYFIQRGLLRAFYLKGDLEVCSWFMKEGDICVSIESFYVQKESYEFIQAIEDCEFFYITYEELEFIYSNFIEFNVIGRVLTIKYLQLWAQQLYAIRMKTAKERYHWLMKYYPELLLRVPQKHIAGYLDITPETLSKIKGIRLV